jgi:dUTP pyrophosphatase
MKFIKLSHEATLPTRGTRGSAGYDLYTPNEITLHPNQQLLVPTDIAWTNCPEYLVGIIKDRSSMAHKHNMVTMAGVIDSDYDKKNIGVILKNTSDEIRVFKKNERIAQMIITQRFLVQNDIVIDDERTGGYGSTGA